MSWEVWRAIRPTRTSSRHLRRGSSSYSNSSSIVGRASNALSNQESSSSGVPRPQPALDEGVEGRVGRRTERTRPIEAIAGHRQFFQKSFTPRRELYET